MKVVRRLFYTVAATTLFLLFLFVAAFGALQNTTVLKKSILPRLSASIGIPIQVEQISFSPLRHLFLKGLTLGPIEKPWLTLKKADLHYNAWSILKSELKVESVVLDGLNVEIIEDASGALNVTPENAESQLATAPVEDLKAAKKVSDFLLSVRDISISDSKFSYVRLNQAGESVVDLRLENFGIQLPELKTDQLATIQLNGLLKLAFGEIQLDDAQINTSLGVVLAKDFSLRGDDGSLKLDHVFGKFPQVILKDSSLQVSLKGEPDRQVKFLITNISKAEFVEPRLFDLAGEFTFALTPAQVLHWRDARFDISQNSENYAAISSTGFFDLNSRESKGTIEFSHFDQRTLTVLLNDGGPLSALDFTGNLNYTYSPQGISSSSELTFAEFALLNNKAEPGRWAGTTLNTSIKYSSDLVQIEKFDLALFDQGQANSNVRIQADAALNGPVPRVDLDIVSSQIDLESVEAFLAFSNPEQAIPTDTSDDRARYQAVSLVESPLEPEANVSAMPNVRLSARVKANKIVRAELEAKNVTGKLEIKDQVAWISSLRWSQNGAPVEVSAQLDLTRPNPVYSFRARVSRLPLKPFASLIADESYQALDGNIQSFTFSGRGRGWQAQDLQDSFQGQIKLSFDEIILPSKLQDVPPFSIIFLPFKVVADAGGMVTGVLLPKSLSSLGTSLRESLDESGRLVIRAGLFDFDARDGNIDIRQASISNNLLPNISTEGTIGFDGKLSLKTLITLLDVSVPLPVTGSLSLPLPDLIAFGPELIRALGLSALNIVGNVGSLVPGMDSKSATPAGEPAPIERDAEMLDLALPSSIN